jgi:spore cortex formation protein SpoVR/YcgB (stage V sporulation)
MHNYRDESFLLQFLTPKLVRDFKLMNIDTRAGLDHWTVTGTAGSESFKALRADLAADYRLESSIPEISVLRYSRDTDRKLVLHHQSYDGKVLLKAQADGRSTYMDLFDWLAWLITPNAGGEAEQAIEHNS